MKKNYFLLVFVFLLSLSLGAQEPYEDIAQPTQVVGRKIDASGEVTHAYEASFSYDQDGKLDSYHFSEFGVSTSFNYENNFLITASTIHAGTWPTYGEVFRYTYEDGKVQLESHEWDGMNSNEYVEYSYYSDGRLARKNYASYNPEDVWGYSLFEYGPEDRTRTESYYAQTFQGTSLVWQLGYRTTCQYNENYALISSQKDTYNGNGDITKTERNLYAYTSDGDPDTDISQTLVENEWVNNAIHKYIYDNEGHLTEQQDGIWDSASGDWNITKKIIHEYSFDDQTYTVSFYKKSGNEWVWDYFDGQKVFFEPELKWQQNALGSFVYEELVGSAQVNQFEFEMIYTKTPTYMAASEKDAVTCNVYPNPGSSSLTVTAPVENSVLRFYDLQGRLLLAKPFDFNTTVNTGEWAPGIYVWEIWNANHKEACGKWVKE